MSHKRLTLRNLIEARLSKTSKSRADAIAVRLREEVQRVEILSLLYFEGNSVAISFFLFPMGYGNRVTVNLVNVKGLSYQEV